MVKVLGIDDKHVRRKSCTKCASILEFTDSETVMKRWSDYSGDSGYYDSIVCPKCGNEVEV